MEGEFKGSVVGQCGVEPKKWGKALGWRMSQKSIEVYIMTVVW